MSDSKNPVNAKAEQGGVSSSAWQQVRDINQHPAVWSQARQQENKQNVKQERRNDLSDSTSVRQRMRSSETDMDRLRLECHNMQISNYEYLVKVFQHLQKKLGTTGDSPKFEIRASKTNVLIWGLFMSSAMKQPSILDRVTQRIWNSTRTNFEKVQNLFNITQKLRWDHQGEILIVKLVESTDPSLTRSTLSHDQAIKWMKAKVLVYSDSVLCF